MNPDAPQAGISVNQAAHAASPHVAKDVDNSSSDLFKMTDHVSFNYGLMIAWLVALFAVLATLYLWWDSRSLTDMLEEKKTRKTAILSQLETPTNKSVEKEAQDFKKAVTALSQAKKSRYAMTEFLPKFYTKINNDVTLTSISLTNEGQINIAGTTGTYRQIADQIVALKSWDGLEDVELDTSSLKMPDEKNPKVQAIFTIKAKIKIAETPVASGASATSSASSATSGAASAATTTTTGGTE